MRVEGVSFWRDIGRLAAAAGLSVILWFLVWEGIERELAGADALAHRLHYARGVSTSLLTAAVVGFLCYGEYRKRAAALAGQVARRTREAREARCSCRWWSTPRPPRCWSSIPTSR